ncbi:MAG: carbohydrate ABC transporter permease [Caldilineaceae bacterium]
MKHEAALPVQPAKPTDWATISIYLALSLLVFLTLYPFAFMLLTSTKSYTQFLHSYWLPAWPLHIGENYAAAWKQVQGYLINTIYVGVVATAGFLISTSMAGFVFARYRFPGKEFLFAALMLLMMIPQILQLIPAFMWVRQLRLLDSYWVLILPYIAGGQAYGVFLMRTFFSTLPQGLFDAAKIDGASDWQIYRQVALPLSKGILATLAILRFQQIWNDLIWPLITVSNDAKRTITVGLYYFQGGTQTQYGAMFAGYFIASLPLLLLFAFSMKQFMAGVTSGAIKA